MLQAVPGFDNGKLTIYVCVVWFALRDFGYTFPDEVLDFLRCDAGDGLGGSDNNHVESPFCGRKKAPDRVDRGRCGSDAWVEILLGTA
ncbi:MAG: hypothetical protein Q8L69_01220, partial [Gallionellaceae bacterium]|nr:hypothetical protein [Gallionellaceae bacterium]